MLAPKRIFELLVVASVTLVSARSFAQGPPPPPVLLDPSAPSGSSQCSDGIDNDKDGLIDYGPVWNDGVHDPGCASAADNVESVGVPVGTSLTTRTSNAVTGGTTYDGQDFVNGIVMDATDDNVTIRNSRIRGVINVASGATNLVIEDTDLDFDHESASVTTFTGDGGLGYTCRRCKVYNGGVFSAGYQTPGGYTVDQSLLYDMWTTWNGTECTHEEAFQDTGANPTSITWSRFVANYAGTAAPCQTGGFSGIGAIYGHSTWQDVANKTLDHNRFERHISNYYCFYFGSVDTSRPTNMRFTNNTMYGCGSDGAVTQWRRDPSNVWSGNTLDDGSTIAEP